MKIDRFVKVMLVIIAVLLGLNCVKDNGSGSSIPFIETKAKATVPAVIQVGKSYGFRGLGQVKIKSIDKESGWIQGEDGIWYNIALVGTFGEAK